MMDPHTHQELVLHRVVVFALAGDYVIRVQFDDGTEQPIDFEPILYGPIFGPLRDPALFKEVRLDSDFGALVWPNGADIDPMVLYDWPAYVDGIIVRRQGETLPE
jgi:hypothetical protein